jgi:hypothetical protein
MQPMSAKGNVIGAAGRGTGPMPAQTTRRAALHVTSGGTPRRCAGQRTRSASQTCQMTVAHFEASQQRGLKQEGGQASRISGAAGPAGGCSSREARSERAAG